MYARNILDTSQMLTHRKTNLVMEKQLTPALIPEQNCHYYAEGF